MIKTCEGCGREFETAHDARFCSKACNTRWHNHQRPPLERNCVWCGKSFLRKRTRDGLYKFCSIECRDLAAAAKGRERLNAVLAAKRAKTAARMPVACIACGKEFFSQRGTGKYCSHACRRKMSKIRERERRLRRASLLESVQEADRGRVEASMRVYWRVSRCGTAHKESSLDALRGISKDSLSEIGDAIFS